MYTRHTCCIASGIYINVEGVGQHSKHSQPFLFCYFDTQVILGDKCFVVLSETGRKFIPVRYTLKDSFSHFVCEHILYEIKSIHTNLGVNYSIDKTLLVFRENCLVKRTFFLICWADKWYIAWELVVTISVSIIYYSIIAYHISCQWHMENVVFIIWLEFRKKHIVKQEYAVYRVW